MKKILLSVLLAMAILSLYPSSAFAQNPNFYFTHVSWEDTIPNPPFHPIFSKCPSDTSTTVFWVEVNDTTNVTYSFTMTDVWGGGNIPIHLYEIDENKLILHSGFFNYIANNGNNIMLNKAGTRIQVDLLVKKETPTDTFLLYDYFFLYPDKIYLDWQNTNPIGPILCKESHDDYIFRVAGYCKGCSYLWDLPWNHPLWNISSFGDRIIFNYIPEEAQPGYISVESENQCGDYERLETYVEFAGCPNDLYIEKSYLGGDYSRFTLLIYQENYLENFPEDFYITWELSDPSAGIIEPIFNFADIKIRWVKNPDNIKLKATVRNVDCFSVYNYYIDVQYPLSSNNLIIDDPIVIIEKTIFVNKNDNEEVIIRRIDGATIMRTNKKEIYVGDLPPGLYLVTCGQKTAKIILN